MIAKIRGKCRGTLRYTRSECQRTPNSGAVYVGAGLRQKISSSFYIQQQIRFFSETVPTYASTRTRIPGRGVIRRKSSVVTDSIFPLPTITESLSPEPKRVPLRRRPFDDTDVTGDDAINSAPDGSISIVQAFYAAKTIDLAPLIISDFSKNATRRKYNKDTLVLQLSPNSAETDSKIHPSYVAVYRFGSVIFFNVSPRVRTDMLEAIKRHATEAIASGFEQKDTFGICVMPNASTTRVTPEHCIVQKLNMNAVAVISEVMAQSVALDSYNDIVDSLLENFAAINSNISTTATMNLNKKVLFSKIAQNNRIFIDLISKLRIKGRSDIAWDQGEYDIIRSGMTEEFDIDDRFELIQFKLDLIQQNSKLFLEVIQHQKSASLEWVIVVLIAFECVLMCLDMSGQGEIAYQHLRQLLG